MSKAGKNGVTEKTPDNIVFGAGTYHKGLKYSEGNWNFEETLIGATSGGGTFKVEPTLTDVEIDGVYVPIKGVSKVKTGEKATMEINPIELTKDLIKVSALAKDGESEDTNYDVIESNANIEAGHYLENIAFVGKTISGKNIIVIMENALCTSGLETGGEDKKGKVGKYTFECHSDLTDDGEYDTLPWHIYYPKNV